MAIRRSSKDRGISAGSPGVRNASNPLGDAELLTLDSIVKILPMTAVPSIRNRGPSEVSTGVHTIGPSNSDSIADRVRRGLVDEGAVATVGVAVHDGTPFPSTAKLVGRWARGRVRRAASAELTYCAEVVAATYQAMGLLDAERPTNYYDPGRFWSGDDLELLQGARLGVEIAVRV